MAQNEGGNRLKCRVCSIEFEFLSHLKRHMRSHSDQRPYECDFCDRTFKYKRGLVDHERMHHPDSSVAVKGASIQVKTVKVVEQFCHLTT